MTPYARHCSRCGTRLAAAPPTRCTTCGYAVYVNAKPSAGVVILDSDGRFLAGRRAHQPRQGEWGLPAGFCDGWEHPADCARREVVEELGMAVRLGPLIGLYIGGYEFQDETVPFLCTYYLGELAPATRPSPDPAEVSEIGWFPFTDPPPLAFPAMDDAVRDAATLLRAAEPRPLSPPAR